VAIEVPRVAKALRNAEKKVVDFCQSGSFSVEKLSALIKTAG